MAVMVWHSCLDKLLSVLKCEEKMRGVVHCMHQLLVSAARLAGACPHY
jgi:hypothetical protein